MNAAGAVSSDTSSYMGQMMQKAMNKQGMALMNLMDVTRKTEVASVSPLGNFGIGGMVDAYI